VERMKNKKNSLPPTNFIKQVLNDITTAEKEIKCKEKEFYKEWTKWGRPKQD
jgi:hypothetical protein